MSSSVAASWLLVMLVQTGEFSSNKTWGDQARACFIHPVFFEPIQCCVHVINQVWWSQQWTKHGWFWGLTGLFCFAGSTLGSVVVMLGFLSVMRAVSQFWKSGIYTPKLWDKTGKFCKASIWPSTLERWIAYICHDNQTFAMPPLLQCKCDSAHVSHVVVAVLVETPWDADCTSSRAINELFTSALWCLQTSREVSSTGIFHTVGFKLRYEGNFLPGDL